MSHISITTSSPDDLNYERRKNTETVVSVTHRGKVTAKNGFLVEVTFDNGTGWGKGS